MRPTLDAVIPYGTAEEMRTAYASTPREVRALFIDEPAALEGDGWLVEAMLAGDVPMFGYPKWVDGICTVIAVPTLQCYPSKSPGRWRVNANGHEFYVDSDTLAKAVKAR